MIAENYSQEVNTNKYYQILGVKAGATVGEIKKAFREKAKQFHPDKKGNSSSAEFIKLKAAYEFLIQNIIESKDCKQEDDPMREVWKSEEKLDSFDYEEWLKERADEESQIKLMLYYYRQNKIEASFETLRELNLAYKRIYFKDETLRNEFMDFGYLLTETLMKKEEYYDAYILIDYIIRLEFGCHYFKYFIVELLAIARKLLRHCIDKKISDELAIDCWERGLELGFPQKDNLYFKGKITAAYQRIKSAYLKKSA